MHHATWGTPATVRMGIAEYTRDRYQGHLGQCTSLRESILQFLSGVLAQRLLKTFLEGRELP